MVLAGVLTACPARADDPTVVEDAKTIVLNEGSFWRFHVTLRPPVAPGVLSTSDDGGPAVLSVKVPYRDYPGIERMETAPPRTDWPTPDFDDAAWPRARAGAAWPGVAFIRHNFDHNLSLLKYRTLAEAVGEHAEKLGPELAGRCRQLLRERIRFCLRCCPEQYGQHYFRSYHHRWQEFNAQLFTTAAEVSANLRTP